MVKCDCGKDFKDARALSTHKRIHCKASKLPCDCKDGGDFEMLTSSTEGAEDYIGKINPDTGKKYKKWCTRCKEVV